MMMNEKTNDAYAILLGGRKYTNTPDSQSEWVIVNFTRHQYILVNDFAEAVETYSLLINNNEWEKNDRMFWLSETEEDQFLYRYVKDTFGNR